MKEKNLFFEDYKIGDQFECDPITFTEESIIDFASKHDPRDFHLSHEAAEKTMFGALIASGFQTLADTWRCWVDKGWENKGTICGYGLDKVRWHRPVFAGDVTRTRLEVIDLEDRPEKKNGIVVFSVEAYNQDDKMVISYLAQVLTSYRKD